MTRSVDASAEPPTVGWLLVDVGGRAVKIMVVLVVVVKDANRQPTPPSNRMAARQILRRVQSTLFEWIVIFPISERLLTSHVWLLHRAVVEVQRHFVGSGMMMWPQG